MTLPFDLFLLVLRVVVGLLLVGHGSQKVFGAFGGAGLEGFRRNVEKMGFRPARPFALAAAFGELIGGLALAVGFLTPVAAAILAVDMLVAVVKVHVPNGLWVTKGGYEYALTLLVVFALYGLAGPGAYAVDAAIGILAWSVPLFAVVFVTGALVCFIGTRPPRSSEQRHERPAA